MTLASPAVNLASPAVNEGFVLRLNPALNAEDYADVFKRDGIVQIRDFFEVPLADHLATVLKERTFWRLTYPDEKGQPVALDSQDLAKIDTNQLWNEIVKRASKGFAYIYLSCYLEGIYGPPEQAEHPLHQLVKFLNSPAFRDFARKVTGQERVDKVDANATWYRPADFLNIHTDRVGLRQTAYTLGFTRHWRADWGGQLLFHDEAGDITRGLMPAFNVLTLFKVPRLHSVAPVALYATEPRFVVSGWLLEDKVQPT